MTALDPSEWLRAGRGRELQFFATDQEVERWLRELVCEAGPVALLGTFKTKLDRRYFDQPFSVEFDEAGELENLTLPINTWICVPSLSPELAKGALAATDATCSLNGLILLQHRLLLGDRYDASRVAIVDRVRSLVTGEVREHRSYSELFSKLRKIIKRDLVYATVQEFPDGRQVEESKLQRMTEGAARQASEGFPFTRAPGRRLIQRSTSR